MPLDLQFVDDFVQNQVSDYSGFEEDLADLLFERMYPKDGTELKNLLDQIMTKFPTRSEADKKQIYQKLVEQNDFVANMRILMSCSK